MVDKKQNTNKTKEDSLNQAISSFTSLTARINEMYDQNRLLNHSLLQTTLKGSDLLCRATKTEMSELDATIAGGTIAEIMAIPSKWAVDLKGGVTDVVQAFAKKWEEPKVSALAALEAQTGLIARDNGVSKLTSVATQISTIADILSTQTDYIKELIAPKTMMSDLQTFALETHQSILDTGNFSTWKLGMVDSASYMVDRQVNWVSKLCTTVYGEKPFSGLVEINDCEPKVNMISMLPLDLEKEKKEDENVALEVALERSPAYQLPEKGKRLIDKIVELNKMCERTGLKPPFKYTGGMMKAAASMGGTVCTTGEALGSIIDCLYMIFYENLERIKVLLSDDAVRTEEVFQCIFRVKSIRTDFRHDYEHGKDKDIRKKDNEIGKSYSHYVGKPVLLSREDYLETQNKMYEEFENLVDYLMKKVVATWGA